MKYHRACSDCDYIGLAWCKHPAKNQKLRLGSWERKKRVRAEKEAEEDARQEQEENEADRRDREHQEALKARIKAIMDEEEEISAPPVRYSTKTEDTINLPASAQTFEEWRMSVVAKSKLQYIPRAFHQSALAAWRENRSHEDWIKEMNAEMGSPT